MTSATETVQESPKSTELFFVLSGEHRTLPGAEVEAILDSGASIHCNKEELPTANVGSTSTSATGGFRKKSNVRFLRCGRGGM